ncbi:hypothetical protein LIER_37914 [Lithospermum erythrorhizon]|uniref:DUF7074 domain-containing protein n=1 Tax=Lithospermum erythrorhizon TaxID=34254 RepID=A0AAV3PSR0_LITER
MKELNSNTSTDPIGQNLIKLISNVCFSVFVFSVFKSIVFYDYQSPVNGSKADECDVSWRFRNKREKSRRKYRKFRRFQIGFTDDCSYEVVHAGCWHSEGNACPPRPQVNSTGNGAKVKVAPSVKDDDINDTVPVSRYDFKNG